MKNISFLKKLKLFREYWILLKRSKAFLTDKTNGLNLRVDNVGRIYTVYTCPDDVSKYGMQLAEKHIKEYISKVDTLLINLKLTEYVGIREITQLIESNELDFLIVFGFKGFDSAKLFSKILKYGILFLLLISFYCIYLFY